MIQNSPGRGFGIYNTKNGLKVGVLNLMGNIFMKKCEDVFRTTEKIFNKFKLKKDADFIVVDFHGEITSEKMAMGHFFDGKATLVVGTHTHVPTSDTMILEKGTAYQTDAGMCGDYNSVIGMNKENSLNRNSIGIELSNKGHQFGYQKYSKAQILSLINLSKYLIKVVFISPPKINDQDNFKISAKITSSIVSFFTLSTKEGISKLSVLLLSEDDNVPPRI